MGTQEVERVVLVDQLRDIVEVRLWQLFQSLATVQGDTVLYHLLVEEAIYNS